MGLHRPFKPAKSPTSVVDSALPVFTKHDDLHKGHKPDQTSKQQQQQQQHVNGHSSQKPSSRSQSGSHSSSQRNNTSKSSTAATSSSLSSTGKNVPRSGSAHSTSSTELWVASANAVAAEKRKAGLASGSEHSAQSVESYYEEEVIDDTDAGENSHFDEAVNTTGASAVDELNLFPERTPTLRFDEYDEMQTVLHINDYTKHEISRSWYKRADYDKMVQLARKTAEKAEQRKKELEQEEQELLRRQLERDGDADDAEEARQNTAMASRSQQRTHSHRSTRGESSRGGRAEDDDERSGESHGDERSSSRLSRRSDRGGYAKSSGSKSKDESAEEEDATGGKAKEKKKPIEYRGLEAWTASGAAKVKLLKESSIELVWNEQSKQWDNGTFDPDRIRAVYVPVSETALQMAYERGKNDALIVQKLLEMDRLAAEKKKRRKLLGKSKALVKKSVKLTGMGVQQTGKLMKKTTKVTKKVAKEATKRSLKAGVATATLDPRMMKEALKVSKRRECKHEVIRTLSRANQEGSGPGSQRDENEVSTSSLDYVEPGQYGKNGAVGNGHPPSHSPSLEHVDSSMTDSTLPPAVPMDSLQKNQQQQPKASTKHKLKLLGVVPIPGTKKTWYKEDRREKKAEKRIQKQKTRPSWEVGTADGKY